MAAGALAPTVRAISPAQVELSNGSSIDVDTHGRIYVADATDVVVLNPDATLLRRVGREGRGPGEFEAVHQVALLGGDSLLVFDPKASRLTLFGPGLDRAAQTLDLAASGMVFPYWVSPARDDGGYVAAYSTAFGLTPNGGTRGVRRDVIRLLAEDASVRRDSVITFPEYEALQVSLASSSEGVLFDPFGSRTLVASDGHRVYTAWTGTWAVDVFAPGGKKLRRMRPAVSPVPRPVTAAETDSVVRAMANPMVPEPVVRRAMAGAKHHDWPILQDMLVDDAGRIWLAETGQRGEPLHWMAFDQDGALLARFDVPVNVSIRLIRGMSAYGISRDENDVPRVVVYDLKPTNPGPVKRS